MRTIASAAPSAKSCAQRTLRFFASSTHPQAGIQAVVMLLVICMMATLLNGCGWRLRGSMELALPPLYLEIQNGSAELRRELPQTFDSSGVQLAPTREAAELILVIQNETQERRVLAVGSAGKVSEYELQYQLRFMVRDQAGKEVMAADTIRQQRDYTFNESEVLAKDEEQQQLFGFMRSMALQTLLRRLQGLSELKAIPATTEIQPGAN